MREGEREGAGAREGEGERGERSRRETESDKECILRPTHEGWTILVDCATGKRVDTFSPSSEKQTVSKKINMAGGPQFIALN